MSNKHNGLVDKISSLARGRFVRNVAMLAGGTAVAQVLNAVAAPLLARLYAPEYFGALALFTAAVTTIASVSTLRYDFAIVLPRHDRHASQLTVLSLMVAAAVSLACLSFSIPLARPLARLLGDPSLESWLPWLGLSTFSIGVYQALSYWSTRKRQFARLATSRVVQTLATVAIQAASGVAGFGAGGLIAGLLIGQLASSLVLTARVPRDELLRILQWPGRGRLLALARRYSDFPKFNAPKGLLNSLSLNLPLVVFASFFSPAAVGCYALTHRVLKVPMSVVGQSIRQVYYERAAQHANNHLELRASLRKATLVLALGCVPVAVALIVLLPFAVDRVLGEAWAAAGTYGQLMVPFLILSIANVPAAATIPILRAQRFFLGYEVALLITRCSSIIIGGLIGSDLLAIGLYSLVGLIFNVLLVYLVDRHAGRDSSMTYPGHGSVGLPRGTF